ncbi:MAG TPA: hypothetical protein VL099_13680 [Candidatus Binatia bacterium]|nr:hypothetical protein [Candidatus Binatia bacterium]
MGNTRSDASARAPRWYVRWPALTPVALLLLFGPATARAQQEPKPEAQVSSPQDTEPEGVTWAGYNVKQTIEFGGRLVSTSGNENVYDTFVNLQQGARLLNFTTEMRSLDNHGPLFDRLFVSSFGYGGDPNDVTVVRLSKNTIYNFNARLRRDQNAWDYSLLANPLNPTAGFTNGPPGFGPTAADTCTGCVLNYSPHAMDTRRYLSDYDLTLFPESKVRVRMGYARNVVTGPALTTYHLSTEAQLFEDVHTTVNTYRLGVDYRIAPRTNISYDQVWNDYKGDTGSTDQNQLFVLSNNVPVDLGIAFNSTLQAMGSSNQPCNNTFNAISATPPIYTVSPTCSAMLSYMTHSRVRTSSPTEQISLQSNYWKPVDITARFGYTGGDADVFGYQENLLGRGSNNLTGQNTTAKIFGEHVMATGDFGFTWHITDAWRFLDSFHYSNFHNPMEYDPSICSFFSGSMIIPINVFSPANALPVNCTAPPLSPSGTPAHTTSSAADLTLQNYGGFLKQEQLTNLAEVDYQYSWRFGARVGFRYRHRDIQDNMFSDETDYYFPSNAMRGNCPMGAASAGCTAFGAGANTYFMYVGPPATLENPPATLINEYSGLFGMWVKPLRNWRISFDTELMSADNVFTRISPRQSQEYRVRSIYKPASWVTISGSIRDWEGRDNVFQVDNLQHDRSYSISATFLPNEKVNFDLAYSYNNVFSQIIICYPGTPIPGGPNQCATVSGLIEQLSTYENRSHYGNADVVWNPVHALSLRFGGNFTGTSGYALNLNPNQEPGPLHSLWLVPTAGFEYAFNRSWMGRAYWNYYGYREDFTPVPQDIYAPRNFHSNNVTLSVRYAF